MKILYHFHKKTPAYGLVIFLLAVLASVFFNYGEAFAIRAKAERVCEEGIKLFNLGKSAEAETKFKESISEDGSYAPAYYFMAQVYEQRNDHDEAVEYVKKALRNLPHEETYKAYLCEINNNMAIEAVKSNNIDRADKLYRANLELLPYHLPTFNRLAALAIKKSDYNDALLQCNRALEKSSSVPPSIVFDSSEKAMLRTHMAICFFELKNYSRAMAEIELARGIKETSYVQKYYKKIMSGENPVILELKKADEAFVAGNIEAARTGYEKVISMYPSSKQAAEKLSIINKQKRVEDIIVEADKLAAEGRVEDAIEKYNEVLSIEPTRVVLKDKIKQLQAQAEEIQKKAAASIRGNSQPKSGNVDVDAKLRQLIEKNQTVDPNKMYEIKYKEAEMLFDRQKYDDALEAYTKLSEENEEFKAEEIAKRIRTIYAFRGEFYSEYFKMSLPKMYVYMIAAFLVALIIWIYFGGQIAVMLKPDPQRNYKKGIEYLDQEKYESAISSFEKALSTVLEPLERTKIKAKMSMCYFKVKNYDKCIKVSMEVLDVDPKNDIVHGYLGNSFLEKNTQSERAMNEYKLLLKKQKDDKRLLTILCNFFIQEDNLSQEAIDVYQKIFAIDPRDGNVRRMLCEAFMRSNDKTDLAIKVYESIINDEPGRKDVKLMLISAKFNRKNYDECIMLCEELFDSGVIENITLEYYTNSFVKLNKKNELYQNYVNYVQKFGDNQILRTYFDKIQSQLAVERLTGGGGPAINFDNQASNAGGSAVTPKPAAAPAVNICKNCAHMNPSGLKVCEHCGSSV